MLWTQAETVLIEVQLMPWCDCGGPVLDLAKNNRKKAKNEHMSQ